VQGISLVIGACGFILSCLESIVTHLNVAFELGHVGKRGASFFDDTGFLFLSLV
jgi:hypothetical protein